MMTLTTGTRWRHHNGMTYAIVCVAEDTRNGQKVVCYRSESDQRVWCQPLARFMDTTDDGFKRFTEVTS